MKNLFRKGLSLILAVTLMLCVFPVAGAEGTETTATPTYEYVFTIGGIGGSGTTYTFDTAVDKKKTSVSAVSSGSWTPIKKVAAQSCAFLEDGFRFSAKVTTASTNYLKGNNYVVFEITVPENGTYHPSLKYFTHRYGVDVLAYLFENKNISASQLSAYVGNIINGTYSDERLFSGLINTYENGVKTECSSDKKIPEEFEDAEDVDLQADKSYYLVFTMDGANSKNDITEITTDNQYYYYHLYSFGLDKVETEPEEPEEVTENISFVATSNVSEDDMMDVEADDFIYDEFTDSIPVGTFVKVTAPKKTGYEFKHWVRGSADNGVYVSDNPVYTFTALTHTFLTAIYENVSNEADAAATVEFYNGNGQYLDKAVSTVGGTVAIPDKAKAPKMTGFEFANQWKTEDGIFDATTPLVKKLTRAVAQFNTPSTTFTVTCDNEEVLLTYGSKHTFKNDKAVYWMREGAVVGYGKSYTHAAWDATEIKTSETGELVPVVLLDDTKKDGAYMIEYNAAGEEILEVGIVFGSGDVSIESCGSKATSQYKNQHGQFTAKPYNNADTVARGYMIYKEDDSYKVIYSE